MISNKLRLEILNLGRGRGTYKPHKHIAILSAIQIAKCKDSPNPHVCYDDEFTALFSKYLCQFGDVNDRDRPYNPFFHLRRSTFWELVPQPGKEVDLEKLVTIGGPGLLKEMVSHVKLKENILSVIQNDEEFLVLEDLLYTCLREGNSVERSVAGEIGSFEVISNDLKDHSAPNPFVAYLNSLHSLDAGNENAMAESQACNPEFSRIQVTHSLVQPIVEHLRRNSGKSVILTGHAGDGKSTLVPCNI